MTHNRRQMLKHLLGLPLFASGILHASTHDPRHQPSKTSSTAGSGSSTLCLHFEGVFGYLVYNDHIEVFTPNLPTEHEYSFGMGEYRLYGYPPMDLDLRQVLPNTGATFRLTDKTRHIILLKSDAGVTTPALGNRYWRIQVPMPSDIVGEGDPSELHDAFKGKHAPLATQLTQVQTSYKFSYELDSSTMNKLHLKSSAAECSLDMTYTVAPKQEGYAHAVSAFHGLRVMLPKLDLDLKDNIGHPLSDKANLKPSDVYVMDGHMVLCAAPSLFITGM